MHEKMEVDVEEKKEVKNEEVAEDDDKLVKQVGHGRSSISLSLDMGEKE